MKREYQGSASSIACKATKRINALERIVLFIFCLVFLVSLMHSIYSPVKKRI